MQRKSFGAAKIKLAPAGSLRLDEGMIPNIFFVAAVVIACAFIMACIACMAWLGLKLLDAPPEDATPAQSEPVDEVVAKDEPTVIGECSNDDFAAVNGLYMAGLRNPKFKWVEAIGKKGKPGILQIVAHTYPEHLPSSVLNGMD